MANPVSARFYITTAIDYPNGLPHMGHAYEKVVSDAYARWYRMVGRQTFFLTGTDENGQKLVKSAAENKRPTKEYVDEQVGHFKRLCQDLRISNDDFIRTTEKRHIQSTQEIWKKLETAGYIYFGEYEGWYCLSCEAFYTKLQAPDLKCPVHQTALDEVKEQGYFFKMSAFQKWIIEHLEKEDKFVVPSSARNEIIQRVKAEELKDLSISRPNQGWGIPVPTNDKYVIYTWFDALINYYAAIQTSDRKEFWPADMHVIGKDITWFHSVIWPCMLKAADIPLPKQVYVHGMVLGQDGRKMSKSLGNGVDPQQVLKEFPVDSFRYYLLRAIPSGLDGAFVLKDLISRHNNELANDYGNLLMRVAKLGVKKLGDRFDSKDVEQDLNFEKLGEQMSECMERREHNRALDLLWGAVNDVNGYMNENEPWKMKGDEARFKTVIYNGLYGMHCFGILASPFLPEVAEKTLKTLSTPNEGLKGLRFGKHPFVVVDPQPLFPKIDHEPKSK